MRIQDGTGSGRSASVDQDNRLEVSAVTQHQEHIVNRDSGHAWSYTFDGIDPTGAEDTFFYFKNLDTQIMYNLADISIASTVAGRLRVNIVSGTASGGSSMTAVPRKTNSVSIPNATVESGADITGLTIDGTALILTLEANVMIQYPILSRIVVSPGQAIAFDWSEATGVLYGSALMYQCSCEFN